MNTRNISSARRQLFTDELQVEEDLDYNNSDLAPQEESDNRLLDEKQEEWNFDFRNGRPLPGRYEWIPVPNMPPSDAIIHTVASNSAAISGNTGVPVSDTTTTRSSRPSVNTRYVPYNLRSRSRNTYSNETRISPVERYRNDRNRNNSLTSTTSSERLEGDVRT